MLRKIWSPFAKWKRSLLFHGHHGRQTSTKTGALILSRSLSPATESTPYRQQLKLEAKQRKRRSNEEDARLKPNAFSDDQSWELTVGIEIHAQLETERKLFSTAISSLSNEPNSNIALCDLAYPGAQPVFQTATLLPALRAALALNCDIQSKSTFDRKHYFYPDQPAGYQITQFYGMQNIKIFYSRKLTGKRTICEIW